MERNDIETLPRPEWRAPRPSVAARPLPSAVAVPAATRSLALLIVEDDLITAEAVAMAVAALGHTVCGTAHTEEEAVALAERTRPDVALVDIQLAGGDGIEAARRMHADFGIRSIFLSGYANHAVMARITESYPLGVVHKPFSLTQLKLALDLAARRIRIALRPA